VTRAGEPQSRGCPFVGGFGAGERQDPLLLPKKQLPSHYRSCKTPSPHLVYSSHKMEPFLPQASFILKIRQFHNLYISIITFFCYNLILMKAVINFLGEVRMEAKPRYLAKPQRGYKTHPYSFYCIGYNRYLRRRVRLHFHEALGSSHYEVI